MAEKPVKAKEPVKDKTTAVEKGKPAAAKSAITPAKSAAVAAKTTDRNKDKAQPKKESRIAGWWRETIGELRKVTWPTIPEARRMTVIVLIVMTVTAIFLGAVDRLFSWLIGLLLAL